MSNIQLTFVNDSNDKNNSQIVIFQQNQSANTDAPSVAWKVIKNCGQGFSHPFVYPAASQIAATDSYGNISPRLAAASGSEFQFVLDDSGHAISSSNNASYTQDITLSNKLEEGAINASIYKDGRLLATTTNIEPGVKASFNFKPTIWVGVGSQIEEGSLINTSLASKVSTEISLEGIKSASIVMTGGGASSDAAPLKFELENIVYS
ncbi:hypothetical protein SAMN05421788_108221 [Filimonas lacunae]|uniref:Aromatic ring-opening dioxygenase LigA n=1 Tax=Filimonas lacunae TaxID=477680 RepID=A0A173MDH1_9BACT|nr:hypothetical protein [Filimonas lacunae]BAV05634.1 hypothetical protein FLA_1645 [Filimonas lacunae]SIT29115.1 hypothetical protein SAMN05421788_108221 [Filimonas lacunae]